MKVVLGVTGGIAAYKAAELVRLLQDRGIRVQVVMTRAAQEFVRPLTFAALSGEKVITDLFGAGAEEPNIDSAVEHIAVAQSIDALVVAPATADVIAKFAHGEANDFLTTLFLATTAPVVVAPAMNVNMWENVATQVNVQTLKARGISVVEPDSGYLACGMIGAGRLAANETIVRAVLKALHAEQDLAGETVLVTAGPTREPIDPVRYIGNRSSGKMGYALAEAAAARGARVTLISGPVHLAPPRAVELIPVRTAVEMREKVFEHLPQAGIVVKSAAVADFHLSRVPDQKVKKTAARLSLELDPTPDILAELGRKKGDRLLIGFAAETQNLAQEARRKLETKNCDMVVGNRVGGSETGFESDQNEVLLALSTGDTIALPRASKREIADRILDEALKLRLILHAANER
jgi:phosphopantothenoylcysteine decarboxylase/phosphopantothenate--cysteine ligase